MRRLESELDGVWLVTPKVHGDRRGHVCELGRSGALGVEFAQLNLCRTVAGALRGLHWQVSPEQGKLVYPIIGRIRDVAVDVRHGSASFGRHVTFDLSADRGDGVWIDPGFAHGFLALDDAVVVYALSACYRADGQRGVRWNDPELHIDWGTRTAPALSPRDEQLPALSEIEDEDFPHRR